MKYKFIWWYLLSALVGVASWWLVGPTRTWRLLYHWVSGSLQATAFFHFLWWLCKDKKYVEEANEREGIPPFF